MTKQEYINLKHGDIVIIPEKLGGIDAGKECIVIEKGYDYVAAAPLSEEGLESTYNHKRGFRNVLYKFWDIPHKKRGL